MAEQSRESEFEVLFKFCGSNKAMTVTRATLSHKIDQHLEDLGFDTDKLATGEYILQKYSKKWDHYVDAKLCEICANDIITVTLIIFQNALSHISTCLA